MSRARLCAFMALPRLQQWGWRKRRRTLPRAALQRGTARQPAGRAGVGTGCPSRANQGRHGGLRAQLVAQGSQHQPTSGKQLESKLPTAVLTGCSRKQAQAGSRGAHGPPTPPSRAWDPGCKAQPVGPGMESSHAAGTLLIQALWCSQLCCAEMQGSHCVETVRAATFALLPAAAGAALCVHTAPRTGTWARTGPPREPTGLGARTPTPSTSFMPLHTPTQDSPCPSPTAELRAMDKSSGLLGSRCWGGGEAAAGSLDQGLAPHASDTARVGGVPG